MDISNPRLHRYIGGLDVKLKNHTGKEKWGSRERQKFKDKVETTARSMYSQVVYVGYRRKYQ